MPGFLLAQENSNTEDLALEEVAVAATRVQESLQDVPDSAVAAYVDDIYLARQTGALIDVLDLERIEVLRGPQGTFACVMEPAIPWLFYGRCIPGQRVSSNSILKKHSQMPPGTRPGTPQA